VFIVACFIIDVIMLVKLRKLTLFGEKAKKFKNQKQMDNDFKDFEHSMNLAIKMVVINTTVGLLFKLPLAFLSIVNVCAQFYKKTRIYFLQSLFSKNFIFG